MTKNENSIKINSEKIEILEEKHPSKLRFYLTILISISLVIFYTKRYLDSGETGYLFIAAFMVTISIIAIITQIFFVTYQSEIDLKHINKLEIKPLIFLNGKVLLEVKIGKKTRPIELTKKKAKEIKNELNNLMA